MPYNIDRILAEARIKGTGTVGYTLQYRTNPNLQYINLGLDTTPAFNRSTRRVYGSLPDGINFFRYICASADNPTIRSEEEFRVDVIPVLDIPSHADITADYRTENPNRVTTLPEPTKGTPPYSYEISGNASWLDLSDRTLTILEVFNDVSLNIRYTVTDNFGYTDTTSFRVRSIPRVQSLPAIGNIGSVEGETVTYTLPEIEGDGLLYSVTTSPSVNWVTFNSDTKVLTVNRPRRYTTPVIGTYTVRDLRGQTKSENFGILDFFLPEQADANYIERQTVIIILPAATGGHPPITYTLTQEDGSALPTGLVFVSSLLGGILTGSLSSAQTLNLIYTATDNDDEVLSNKFDLNIHDSILPNNLPDRTFFEKEPLDLLLPEARGGTAPYAYQVTGLPNGLVFNTRTRKVTGRVLEAALDSSGDPTEYEISYTATDSTTGTALTDTETFNLTILDSPSITLNATVADFFLSATKRVHVSAEQARDVPLINSSYGTGRLRGIDVRSTGIITLSVGENPTLLEKRLIRVKITDSNSNTIERIIAQGTQIDDLNNYVLPNTQNNLQAIAFYNQLDDDEEITMEFLFEYLVTQDVEAPTVTVSPVSNIVEGNSVDITAAISEDADDIPKYDNLSYAWTVESGGGSIVGNGLSATYTSSNVAAHTEVTVRCTATATGTGIFGVRGDTDTSFDDVVFTVNDLPDASAGTIEIIPATQPPYNINFELSTPFRLSLDVRISDAIRDTEMVSWAVVSGPGTISSSGNYELADEDITNSQTVVVRATYVVTGTGVRAERGTSDSTTKEFSIPLTVPLNLPAFEDQSLLSGLLPEDLNLPPAVGGSGNYSYTTVAPSWMTFDSMSRDLTIPARMVYSEDDVVYTVSDGQLTKNDEFSVEVIHTDTVSAAVSSTDNDPTSHSVTGFPRGSEIRVEPLTIQIPDGFGSGTITGLRARNFLNTNTNRTERWLNIVTSSGSLDSNVRMQITWTDSDGTDVVFRKVSQLDTDIRISLDSYPGTLNRTDSATISIIFYKIHSAVISTFTITKVASIREDQTVELTASLEATYDTVTYIWTVQSGGGTISGTGTTVTYNPPNVASDTQVTVGCTALVFGSGRNAASGTNAPAITSETFTVTPVSA